MFQNVPAVSTATESDESKQSSEEVQVRDNVSEILCVLG